MSETCRVIINQVKQKLHLVGYLLIRYYKDARYHEHNLCLGICVCMLMLYIHLCRIPYAVKYQSYAPEDGQNIA